MCEVNETKREKRGGREEVREKTLKERVGGEEPIEGRGGREEFEGKR